MRWWRHCSKKKKTKIAHLWPLTITGLPVKPGGSFIEEYLEWKSLPLYVPLGPEVEEAEAVT